MPKNSVFSELLKKDFEIVDSLKKKIVENKPYPPEDVNRFYPKRMTPKVSTVVKKSNRTFNQFDNNSPVNKSYIFSILIILGIIFLIATWVHLL